MKNTITFIIILFAIIILSSCEKDNALECTINQERVNEECVDIKAQPEVNKDNVLNINFGNLKEWETFTNFKEEPLLDISNGEITFTQVYQEHDQDSKNVWARKLTYTSMSIAKDATYTFQFDAEGTTGETFTVYFESGNSSSFVEHDFLLDGSLQSFSFDIEYPVATTSGGILKIGFGTFKNGSQVTLSNIEITKEEFTEANMNILFIGNSFTFYHDMPVMVENMAAKKGHSIKVSQVTYGGYQLSNFLNEKTEANEAFINALEETNWDYVILQESSFKPILYKDEFLDSVEQMKDLVSSYGAEIILFSTWAYRDGSSILESTGYSYQEFYELVTEAYIEASNTYNTLRAPVGSIFYTVKTEEAEIDLLSSDNLHSSITGSYVAALTFYTMLYGEESNIFIPDGVDYDSAMILRDYVYDELDKE